MAPATERWVWGLALLIGVAPLWASQQLPLVDLPQHLHLISVLHRLHDTTTLYPEVFARRPELTPYLGYYYVVSLLNWLLPLELANRVFLTAYAAGLPLSLAFLLRSLKRQTWPALLAIPFVYGDSLAWGFVNYCSALPLAFLTCGLFVRAIADVAYRTRWMIGLMLALVAVLLFHVQVFAFLAVALPFLLFTTPAPEGNSWRARRHALVGVVPGVVLFVLWVGLRFGQPAEVAPGQPWKSWGPMLSAENLSWKTYEQNRDSLLPTLANMLPDGSDIWGVRVSLVLAGLGLLLALTTGRSTQEGRFARWRIVGLFAIALGLYFALPFDIRGYMYYLNTRYAHLAAPLLVACVPPLTERFRRLALLLAAASSLVTAVPLWRGFASFDAEAASLTRLAEFAGPKPKVMGLIYATGSRASTHPVFLHASTVVARARGGLTNFSFALTPHSPLMYRGEPPPTFPSEWRPDQMSYETQGRYYDHFVVRGPDPTQVFHGLIGTELYVAAHEGDFWLVRRR